MPNNIRRIARRIAKRTEDKIVEGASTALYRLGRIALIGAVVAGSVYLVANII